MLHFRGFIEPVNASSTQVFEKCNFSRSALMESMGLMVALESITWQRKKSAELVKVVQTCMLHASWSGDGGMGLVFQKVGFLQSPAMAGLVATRVREWCR